MKGIKKCRKTDVHECDLFVATENIMVGDICEIDGETKEVSFYGHLFKRPLPPTK